MNRKINYMLWILLIPLFGIAQEHFRAQDLNSHFSKIENMPITIDADEYEQVTSMSFYKEKIFIGVDFNYIVAFNKDGEKLIRFGRDKYTPLRTYCLSALPNGDILTSDVLQGQFYLSIHAPNGIFKSRKNFNPNIQEILYDSTSNEILIGGLQVYNFNQMLKQHDKDTFFPSKKNQRIWKNYYKTAKGHWVTKLNLNYNIIDSLVITEGDMNSKIHAASDGIFSMDLDSNDNLWLFAYPNSKILVLDKKNNIVRTFYIENEDYKLPSLVETDKEWYKLEKRGAIYFDYTLNVTESHVYISYETEQRDLTNSSRRMAIYTIDGKFLDRFDFPYKPYKHNNALYFWMKEDNELRLMKCIK